MSHDIREECLEFHMTSLKYLECLMTSEKNVASQWWQVGVSIKLKPAQTKPVSCYENTFISDFGQMCI